MVDPVDWRLSRNGREVHLEPRVLKLLVYLMKNRDRLVTRDELMQSVWGDTVISEAALSKAVGRLRKALGDNASAPQYLETVHSLGYRFLAHVDEIELSDHPEHSPKDARPKVSRRTMFAAVFAALSLILLALLWPKAPEQAPLRAGTVNSLAVLPLANLTGTPEKEYFVDGLQEVLITELSRIGGLRVTSRQSTMRYKRSELPLTQIAAELGVDALVEGSALQVGDRLEITVQLIDGHTDEHLWAQRYERDTRHVFDLLKDVATTISAEISPTRVETTPESLLIGQIGPIDPEASQACLLGIEYLNRFSRDGLQTAIEQFRKALAIEPDFALAWGHLAAAQVMMALHGYAPASEAIEQARVSALRALELDDGFYTSQAALGWIQLFKRDLPGACEAFREALRLNPSDPYSLHGDADCLMLSGRMEESIAQVRKAQLVDPFAPMHNRPLPFHLFVMRRYDEAIAAAFDLQERIPGYSVHWLLAVVYWQQGHFEKAIEEQRRELEWQKDGELLAALNRGADAAGPTGGMRAMAEALVARSRIGYVDPFKIGEAFILAGAIDEAFHWLDQAIERGSLEAIYIDIRPDFDPLRGDPRYPDLVRKVGLRTDAKDEAATTRQPLSSRLAQR